MYSIISADVVLVRGLVKISLYVAKCSSIKQLEVLSHLN